MAAVASIVIQVDEKGAISAINQVTGAVQNIEPALRRTGSAGKVVMTELAKQHRQANDAAQLLGRTLGVQLPRELNRFLAQSRTVAPILAGAFNVAIIGGFVTAGIAALAQLPGAIDKVVERFTHAKEMAERLAAANGAITDSQREPNLATREYADAVSDANLEGSKLAENQMRRAQMRLAEDRAALAGREALLRQLAVTAKETTIVAFELGASFEVPTQAAKEAQLQIKELTPGVNALRTAVVNQEKAVLDAEKALNKAYGDDTRENIRQTTNSIKQQHEALRGISSIFQERTLDLGLTQASMQAGNAAAAALDEINQAAAESLGQLESANERTAEAVVVDWRAARDRMADQFVSLFDDITGGNIGRAFQNAFKRLIAEMVANWALGVRQMGSVGIGGGSGSALGSVLGIGGGLFGLGGGAGATPPFVPSSAGSLAGLPLSAGGAVTTSTALPAGGSLIGAGGTVLNGGGGGLRGLLGPAAGAGLMQLLGGAQLAGAIGFGNPVRGAIAGGLGTALGLSAIAAISPAVLDTAFGSFFGPLGIGIGAGIGALIGVLGNSKRARQRHELHLSMFRDLQTLEDQYKFFAVDYGSAVGQLQRLREEYAQQFKQLKGPRAEFVDKHFDTEIFKINQIEAERQRRAALVFGPAMFDRGGVIGASARRPWMWESAPSMALGGAVPIIAHEGEGVVTRQGMKRIGESGLERINNGRGGGAGDTFVLQIQAVDMPSFARYMNRYLRNGGYGQMRGVASLLREEGR